MKSHSQCARLCILYLYIENIDLRLVGVCADKERIVDFIGYSSILGFAVNIANDITVIVPFVHIFHSGYFDWELGTFAGRDDFWTSLFLGDFEAPLEVFCREIGEAFKLVFTIGFVIDDARSGNLVVVNLDFT